jgi:uncharacterized iron-regulated membrane protein
MKVDDREDDRDAADGRLVASVPGQEAFHYRIGEQVTVGLRADRCHWFDPETGKALAHGTDREGEP